MNCEFCDEPNHDRGVQGMTLLFSAVMDVEETSEELHDKAHAAWRNFRRAESISIPNDGSLLASWLDHVSG